MTGRRTSPAVVRDPSRRRSAGPRPRRSARRTTDAARSGGSLKGDNEPLTGGAPQTEILRASAGAAAAVVVAAARGVVCVIEVAVRKGAAQTGAAAGTAVAGMLTVTWPHHADAAAGSAETGRALARTAGGTTRGRGCAGRTAGIVMPGTRGRRSVLTGQSATAVWIAVLMCDHGMRVSYRGARQSPRDALLVTGSRRMRQAAQVAMQAAMPRLTGQCHASVPMKDLSVQQRKVCTWSNVCSLPTQYWSTTTRSALLRCMLSLACLLASPLTRLHATLRLGHIESRWPILLLTAGLLDRALPAPVEPSPGPAATAADAEADQPSVAAVVAEPMCSSVSPLTEPNTPAAGVDDPKHSCGQTASAPSTVNAAGLEATIAQSVQAKQQQRRQAVARFKVRLLERAPSPAVTAPTAQPTAAPTAEAVPVQPTASAATTAIVPPAAPAAVPQRSVLEQQPTVSSLPGTPVGQGASQTTAELEAPTANGTHDPRVAASPVIMLPARDAPLSALLPARRGVLAPDGPAAVLSDPPTPPKAKQDSPRAPQVTLRSRLA